MSIKNHVAHLMVVDLRRLSGVTTIDKMLLRLRASITIISRDTGST